MNTKRTNTPTDTNSPMYRAGRELADRNINHGVKSALLTIDPPLFCLGFNDRMAEERRAAAIAAL